MLSRSSSPGCGGFSIGRRDRRFAVRNMRVAARKTPGRVDMPQYSPEAIFEALVNAVAHRDYSMSGRRIRLSMFEDRRAAQPSSPRRSATFRASEDG